ncbi:MAG TPA: aldo/keto reductase [Xanthobacteraceae bacterium]|jgi:aryl-alcohol dehydrogenase-like predicted oxidoreductase|nr:aldo/keto reductase [Xanthobacteraceae bacterium]
MLQRNFGATNLRVSAVGLGCNNFGTRLDLAGTRNLVDAALDAGITLFDTADIYGNRGDSERFLGAALGSRRKDIVLVTKFGLPMDGSGRRQGGSRRYVRQAAEASLKRLATDWIDVYYFHRPDPATPIEETLEALDKLVRQGKVRHTGCSNFSAPQMREAQDTARTSGFAGFATAQEQYNLLSREIERDVLPTIAAEKLALLPYFPLASGMLTGKYRLGRPIPEGTRLSNPRYSDRFLNDENLRIVERLETFCAARGRTLLELAFAWLLAKPVVASVIAGASTPEQLMQNAGAVGWTLTQDELAEVDRITSP